MEGYNAIIFISLLGNKHVLLFLLQWARDIGQLSKPIVRVPLHSCEHFYLVTQPMPGVDNLMPGMLLCLPFILDE